MCGITGYVGRGPAVETALTNLLERVPLLDVRMFVSSVMLQKQTGGNLGEILMRLSHVIRERFRLISAPGRERTTSWPVAL